MSEIQVVAASARARTDNESMDGGDMPKPGESKSLSVSEAASLLAKTRHEARRNSEEQPVEDVEQPEEEIAAVEEQPEDEGSEDEAQSEGEELEVDEELEVTEQDSEEQLAEEATGPFELTEEDVIMVDGEEMTLAAIRESGLRSDDYTQKTQALSEQRNILKQRETLVGIRLGQMEQNIAAAVGQFDSVDWMSLSQQDPEKYRNLRTQQDAAKQHLHQVQEDTRGFLQKVQAHEAEAQRAQAARAAVELKKAVPGWNNGMYYSLVDYADSVGFDRAEVLKYVDPNVFQILRKAKMYDEAQQSATTTKKVVKAGAKRTLRAKAPTGRARPSAEKQSLAKATKQATETGKVSDAVSLLQARRAAAQK